MKKNNLILSVLLCLSTLLVSTMMTLAEENSPVSVAAVDQYMDTQPTWYCDVVIPAVSGMSDKKAQSDLNKTLTDEAQTVIDTYKTETEQLAKDFPGDDKPHIGYEYNFTVDVDDEDYLVFHTEFFSAAGSSSSVHHYYTFDREDGKQLTFDSLFTKSDYLSVLTDYIRGEMKKANEKNGMYWLDDDSLDTAMASVAENSHWYLKNDDELVIIFDKYEVAPGAMGTSAFAIPEDVFDSVSD